MAPKNVIVLSHLLSALIYFCCRHFDGVETIETTSGTLQSYFDQLKSNNCALPYHEWRHPTDSKANASVLEPCTGMTGNRPDYNETEKFRYDLCEVVLHTLVDVCENSGVDKKKRFDKPEFENTMKKVTTNDVCTLRAKLNKYDEILHSSPTLGDDKLCKQHCGTDGSSGEMKSLCDVMATTICQSLEDFACRKLLESKPGNGKTQEKPAPETSNSPSLPFHVFTNENCTFPYEEWHHPEVTKHRSMIEPCMVMTGSRADYNETDKFKFDLCKVFMDTLVNVCNDSTEDLRKRFNKTEFGKTMSTVSTKGTCSVMSRLGANFSDVLVSAMKNDTLCKQNCNTSNSDGIGLTCAVVATTVCQSMEESVCLEKLKDIPEGKPDDKEKSEKKKNGSDTDNAIPNGKTDENEKDEKNKDEADADNGENGNESTGTGSGHFEGTSSHVFNLVPYLIIFLAVSGVILLLYHQRDKVKACFSKGQQSARDIMKKKKEAKYRRLKKEDGLMLTVEEADEVKKYIY